MYMFNIDGYHILLLSFAVLFTGTYVVCTYAIICHVNTENVVLIGSSFEDFISEITKT